MCELFESKKGKSASTSTMKPPPITCLPEYRDNPNGSHVTRRSITAKSPLRRQLLAEQSARPEDERQDQDREHRHFGPLVGDAPRRHRLDDADDEAAEHRARDVADAAEHGGGEGLQPRLIPVEEE